MHSFSPSQRSKLLGNPNVEAVTEKSVVFNAPFKVKTVKKYLAGNSSDQIFKESGIPIEYFKPGYCRLCLKRWVKKFKTHGEESLLKDGRGSGSKGRPKKERLEDLTYEELLALVEIQKGALEELKKQRALAKKKY